MDVSFSHRYLILNHHGYNWAAMLYTYKFTIRFWSTQWDATEDGSWYVIIPLLFCRFTITFCNYISIFVGFIKTVTWISSFCYLYVIYHHHWIEENEEISKSKVCRTVLSCKHNDDASKLDLC